MKILDILVDKQLVASKSEGRRLLYMNGVKVNNEIINDECFQINEPCEIKVGRQKRINIQ